MLQNLFWYFGSYPCITKHIHVFRILYMYYRTYTCLTELILVLQNLYWSYETYTCITILILEFQILFMCEGTRRYDKSEQIRIISHTRLNQTSTDTDLSLSYVQITYSLYGSTRRYDWTYTYFTELILILPIREYPWVLLDLIRYRSTVGTTGQIQRYIQIFTLILYSVSYYMSV